LESVEAGAAVSLDFGPQDPEDPMRLIRLVD
jgi:hypothetical protein